jgi:Tfp pilus assembly protein PilV
MTINRTALRYVLVATAIIAAFVLGMGMLVRTADNSKAAQRQVVIEQQRLMRDALNMAQARHSPQGAAARHSLSRAGDNTAAR